MHPTAPRDSADRLLDFSDKTKYPGEGSIKVFFTLIDNNENYDLVVIFDSGDYYFFSSFGTTANPSFIKLNTAVSSVTIDFPDIPTNNFKDFLLEDFNGDGFNDILIFYNNNEVGFTTQYLHMDGRLHLFGTDEQAGDIYSRIIWALQLDLILAIWVVLVSVAIGTFLGAIAGYYGGWIDNLLMRITDIFFAFPGLILAMAIAAALGRNMFNLSIALIVVWWSSYARIVRGQVISEKNRLYVESARSIGLSNLRIIFKHVLPNSIYPILVAATLDLGGVLLTAAGLSFIGFGAEAGDAELGRMIADGRQFFLQSPWIVFFPGIFIFFIVLAFNLIGDGLRDVMDPKLRR